MFTISGQSRAFTALRLIDIVTAVHSHMNELATLEFALQQLARLEDELAPDGALPGPLMLALSCRTRIGTVERANAIAAATLPAEAQRRLTVMPIEITTGYRRPDGQWPPRCPVAWLVHEFNARVASHVDAPDPHDRRLGPDQFVVSLRHYRPAESELSRERLKAALSTAEGLLLQPRGEGELIELSDDEAVAAAVMLPMVAADRLAPSASSHTGGAFKRNAGGSSEATFRDGPLPSRAALQTAVLLAAPRPDCRRGGFAFASDAWVGQGSGRRSADGTRTRKMSRQPVRRRTSALGDHPREGSDTDQPEVQIVHVRSAPAPPRSAAA